MFRLMACRCSDMMADAVPTVVRRLIWQCTRQDPSEFEKKRFRGCFGTGTLELLNKC